MSHFCVAVFTQDGTEEQVVNALTPFDEEVSSDHMEFAEFEEDDDFEVCPITGKRGYWRNPNAKWDWWVVGGRWRQMLELVNGEKVNAGPVKDMVFGAEQVPFAFLTTEGVWFERGAMGWFGISDETIDSRTQFTKDWNEYLETAKAKDLYITIVDCHI